MTIYILFFIAIVLFLYLWFKGKNLDSSDNWTSKLNEKNEKNIIRDEFNSARDSNNALLWWLTWYTIANLFNQHKDEDNVREEENKEEDKNEIKEDKNEENTWNDEQWIENENSDFEQDFDDFDSSFDDSFDSDWWFDDWWFDD